MASAASSLRSAGGGNARFNAEAAAWDTNPFVHTASRHALDALLSRFPALSTAEPTLDVLEIGCGTGLLSFLMAPYAREIVAVDASEGMIEVLNGKLEKAAGVGNVNVNVNVKGVCVLLEDPEDESLPPAREGGGRMKFDLITSHLVLHHIPDLRGVLETMLGCLKPGGSVALTDFEDYGPKARKFHPKSKMEGVERDGIARVEMARLMEAVGFVDVRVEVGWTMEKRVERTEGEFGEKGRAGELEGEIAEFPFVVCMGKRR